METYNDVLVLADSIREDLGSFCQGDLFADVTISLAVGSTQDDTCFSVTCFQEGKKE